MILFFYLFYLIISDLIIDQIFIKFFNSELYSFRVFTIIEFISLSAVLFILLQTHTFKRILLVASSLFFAALIVDLLTNSVANFDSIPTGVESILILFYCILLLYESLSEGKPLFSFSVFFAVSLIIFFSGTFFLFIMSQNNFENEEFSQLYDYIVAISKILMTLIMSIGLFANNQSKVDAKHHRTFQNI
ncbi:MAG: hypothetical protein RLZZ557_534 [Bacteroidota bacterium]